MKLYDNYSLLEFLNKWYEFNKFVSDEELLKIGRDVVTKKRAIDDAMSMNENMKLRKKLSDAMEVIRKLKEYFDALMNMEVKLSTKQIPKEIRKKICGNKDRLHREVSQNINNEWSKREEFKRINDDSVFVTGEKWKLFKYRDYK